MDLKQLNTFFTLSRLKNFTKTAEELNYAQSNITMQIKQLENSLHVKLFDRIGKTVALTPEGECLLPYASKVLSLSAEIEQLFSDHYDTGRLSIGASESLVIYKLPAILGLFRASHPGVELQLKIIENDQVFQALNDNSLDAAIILDNLSTDNRLVCSFEMPAALSLLAHPDNPLCLRSKIFPMDLKNQSFILTGPGCRYRKILEDYLQTSGITPEIILETGSVPAIKESVLNGLGICYLPDFAVKKELEEGRLVRLPVSFSSHMNIKLITHKDKWISPNLSAFLDLFKNQINL